MPVQLLRRCFTVEEYHQMVQAGILAEDDQVELIEGEIVEMYMWILLEKQKGKMTQTIPELGYTMQCGF